VVGPFYSWSVAANYYHALRRQIRRNFRKPLVRADAAQKAAKDAARAERLARARAEIERTLAAARANAA